MLVPKSRYYICPSCLRRANLSIKNQSIGTIAVSVITHDQAAYECLKRKLINYHALAADVKPEVEKLAGRPTSINTLVVAIKRFSDTLKEVDRKKLSQVLRGATITLSSDVVDVTITTSRSELLPIMEKIARSSSNLTEPVHLFQLSRSIRLIADEREYKSYIRSVLDKSNISRETALLSRLDLRLSQAVEQAPEFGLFLTELLYRHGIKLSQTYIGDETILILSRDEGPRAYEILRYEIDRSDKAKAKGQANA